MSGRRLILDQMLDAEVAGALLANGYDVVRVSEFGLAQADDAQVLAKAMATGRVLVTLDEHFGDWAVLPLLSHTGVIRIKADPATTDNVLTVLIPFLRQFRDKAFDNMLAIVSKNRVRWIKTGG